MRIDLLDSWDIDQGPAAPRIGDLVADGLFAPLRDQIHEVSGRLTRDGKGLIAQTALFAVHTDDRMLARGERGFPGALRGKETDRSEDRIRLEYPVPHLLGRIETERLGLPEGEKAGDMIDVGIGEKDSLNWSPTRSVVRVEAIERLDLLPDIRAGIDEVPADPIGTEGDRGLSPRPGAAEP
jgi:hypothetical protein